MNPKYIENVIGFMLAVLLFATLGHVAVMNEAPVMETNEQTQTNAEPIDCALEEGRLMQTKICQSRHAFKRAVRRFSLRFGRTRRKWRIIRRMLGIGQQVRSNAVLDEKPNPEVENEQIQYDICPICEVVESNTAPFFSNGLCADCCIDEGLLEESRPVEKYSATSKQNDALRDKIGSQMMAEIDNMTGFEAVEHIKNRDTAPLSAVIASVIFALIMAVFAPKLLSSGLFLVGATRQPKPAKYEQFGKLARKHSKNAIQCKVCAVSIEKGEYKVMLPLAGYKQNKPHCYDCAVENYDFKNGFVGGAPSSSTTVSTPPAPQPVKKMTIDLGKKEPTKPKMILKPKPVKIDVDGKTNEEIAQQIVALLDSQGSKTGANMDEVYDLITQRIDENDTHYVQPRFAGLRREMDDAITAQNDKIEALEDKIKSSAPIKPLMIQVSKKAKPVNCGDVYHPQVPTVYAILTCRDNKGFPLPVYLVGEAGVGKSFCVDTIRKMLREAKILKGKTDNYGEIVCFADMERGDLLGTATYNLTTGTKTWVHSGLVKPLLEGGVAFVDEIDKADPAVLTLLNGVLASRTIINPANGEVLPVHKDCFIIAAGNTTGMSYDPNYVSAQKQDLSLIDRFSGCVVEYGRSLRVMAGMLGLKNAQFEPEFSDNCEPVSAQELYDAYIKICEMTEQSAVSFSYRALSHGQAMARNGWGLKQIVARWSQILDDEMKRSVAVSFDMDAKTDMSIQGMLPENIAHGLNINGGV